MTTKIIISDSLLKSGTVTNSIIVSKNLKKYFRSFIFYSKYDVDIVKNISILNIPVVSTLLPLAWITGADIYVEKLDRTYKEAMEILQNEYKKMHPQLPFNTEIYVNKLVENDFKDTPSHTALLFSGGLDSTYSLFNNIALNPRLIMIHGSDIHTSEVIFWEKVKTKHSNFAKREGLLINFIQSNTREILNESRVNYDYRKPHKMNFWLYLRHSLLLLGLTAPLSIGRFNRLIIAATRTIETPSCNYPMASVPNTDEKIAWGNLRVKHDGYIYRHKKIMALKKYIKEHELKLRVCFSKYEKLNCSKCEKCLRTITPLVLIGIDPNKCGFKVDNSTFSLIRYLFENKKITQLKWILHWQPLQKLIPDEIESDIYGSKNFFNWFKTLNTDSVMKHHMAFKDYLDIIYYKLPYPISKFLYSLFIQLHLI